MPLRNMKFFKRYKDPQKDGVSLKIRLTNKCNYSCPYCFYKDNSSGFLDLNTVYEFIILLCEKFDYFYIYFHGGEPTLHPDFTQFLNRLNNLFDSRKIDFFIYFDTNFTKSPGYWGKFYNFTDPSRTKVNCTLHPNQCKDVISFIDKFESLSGLKQFNIMVEHDTFDECRAIFEKLNPEWNVVPKPIFYEGNEFKYSEVQKRFFYDNDKTRQFYYVDNEGEHIFSLNEIELENLNNFSMMRCEYGNKNVVIDVNGDMYYCVAHQLTYGKPFMNLLKDGPYEYLNFYKPNICIFNKCSACDLRILKGTK